jgi:hypothetical protein
MDSWPVECLLNIVGRITIYVLFWWNIKAKRNIVAASTLSRGVLALKVALLTTGALSLNLPDRHVGEVDARSGDGKKKGRQAQSGQSSRSAHKTVGPDNAESAAIFDTSPYISDMYVKISTLNSGLQEQMLRVMNAKQLEAADENTLTNVSELVNKLFDLG